MRSLSNYLFLIIATALTVPSAFSATDAVLKTPPVSKNCPVVFSVEQRSDGKTLPAEKNAKGPARGVHITVQDPKDQKLHSAEVVLHGLSPKGRVLPAGSQSGDELTKNFHLVRDEHSDQPIAADLWMHNIAAVRSVSITAIEYTDGTRWQESKSSSCVATPNRVMHVSGAH